MFLNEGENLKACWYQTRLAATEAQRTNHWASPPWNGRYNIELYIHT